MVARVLIVTYPEAGHVIPTLDLATRLVQIGHEVCYLAPLQLAGAIVSSGAILERLNPSDESFEAASGDHLLSEYERQYHLPRLAILFRRISEVTAARAFDAVLLDWAFARHRLFQRLSHVNGNKLLLFSTSLPWWGEFKKKRPWAPLLIFCPLRLEIPAFQQTYPGLYYVEDRKGDLEPHLQSNGTKASSVLIAFGSQAIRYSKLNTLLELFVQISKRHPSIHFTFAAGSALRNLKISTAGLPANLSLLEEVPQRSILSSSTVFVSHGGLGSVKEAVAARVPMLILPQSHDQPYNAMRVNFHGLGRAIFEEELSIDVLEDTFLDLVLNNEQYRTRLHLFHAISSETSSFELLSQLGVLCNPR